MNNLYNRNIDYSMRWANKYAIRWERYLAKNNGSLKQYSSVFLLCLLLHKLNVKTGC